MKKFMRVAGALALFAAGASAAAVASGTSPASLAQTTGTTTATTGTTTGTTTTTRKVTICHHTRGKGGTHHVTITVSQNAVRAHERHGDTIGTACTAQRALRQHSTAAHTKRFHKGKTLRAELKSKANKGKGKGKRRP